MVEPVACELVAVRDDLPQHLRMLARVGAENEEGRAMAALGQLPADLRGELRIGSVVERQREAAWLAPHPRHPSEHGFRGAERPDEIKRSERAAGDREEGLRAEQLVEKRASGRQGKGDEPAGQPRRELAHRQAGAGWATRTPRASWVRSRS